MLKATFLIFLGLMTASSSYAQSAAEKASALKFFEDLVSARLASNDEFSLDHTPDPVILSYGLGKSAAAARQKFLARRNPDADAEFQTVTAQIDPASAKFGAVKGRAWASVPMRTVVRSKISKTSSEKCALIAIYRDQGTWFFIARDKGKLHPALRAAIPELAVIQLQEKVSCKAMGS